MKPPKMTAAQVNKEARAIVKALARQDVYYESSGGAIETVINPVKMAKLALRARRLRPHLKERP